MSLSEEEIIKRIHDSYELPNNVLDAVPEPLVSIRTSTYQHYPYIKRCIDGVLMQKTNFSIEFIIGEDFSTDGTRELVFDYAKKYPNIIRVITANYNVGIRANGRRCIYAARGKYMAICEGDDYWTDPLKLQKQVDFLENNPEYSLVWSDVDKLNQSTGLIVTQSLSKLPIQNTLVDFLVKGWFIAPCTWVFRMKILNSNTNKYPYRKNYPVGDLRTVLIAIDHGKIAKVPETSVAIYRVLEKSASHFKSFKDIFRFQQGIFFIQYDFAKHYKVSHKIKLQIILNFIKSLSKGYLYEIKRRLIN